MDTDSSQIAGQALDTSASPADLIPKLKTLSVQLAQHQQNSEVANTFKSTAKKLLGLLNHDDKQVRLLSVCCLVDILRIVAPNPIYRKTEIKHLFEEITQSTKYLRNSSKPSFQQIMHIITVLSHVSGVSLCIQYGFNDILVRLMSGLIEQIDEETGVTNEQTIVNILFTAVDESENLMEQMLYPVVSSLSASYKNKARYRIAVSLLSRNTTKVIQALDELTYKLFSNAKSLKSSGLIGNEKYGIVYELFKINHDYVMQLLNYLEHEMALKDKTKAQKAVELVGKMASSKKSVIPCLYRSLFHAFLKKFETDETALRMAAVSNTLRFVKNLKAPHINTVLAAVKSRLRDSDEEVRRLAVQHLAKSGNFIELDEELVCNLCDRIRDRKPLVREEALMQLAELFFSKCVQNHIVGKFEKNQYNQIGDYIVATYKKIPVMEDQLLILKTLEEVLVPWKLKPYERINCVLGLQKCFGDEAKEAYRLIVKGKSKWGKLLYDTLQCRDMSEFEDKVSLIAGNLKEPLTNLELFPDKAKSSSVLVKILKEDNIAQFLNTLVISTATYYEKIEALKAVLDLCNNEPPAVKNMMLNLTFRSCNVLMCPDQMDYILSKTDRSTMEVLLIFGQSFPEIILPHLSSMIAILNDAEDKSPVLELLQYLIEVENIQIEVSYDLPLVLTKIINSGTTKEARYACRLVTKLMSEQEVHEKLLKPISESLRENLQDISKIRGHIGAINSIISSDPELILPYISSVLDVIIDSLIPLKVENTSDNDISEAGHCKCDALQMIINLILKNPVMPDTYSPVLLFKMIMKLATNLTVFLYKRYDATIEEVLPNRDSIEFRKVAISGAVHILNSKDFKKLMTPKVLLQIGCVAICEEAELRATLGDALLNELYEKGLIHPVMISILGLLATDPTYSKSYKEALVSVFEGMSKKSSIQDTPDTRVSLLPEAYIIYLIFLVARLPSGGEKNIQRILTTYLDCIKKARKTVEIPYLLSLSRSLKNYDYSFKKMIECDLELYWGKLNANVGLSTVSDKLQSHLKSAYSDYKDDTKTKFFVPSAFLERKSDARFSNENASKALDFNLTPAPAGKRKVSESSSERPRKRIKK